MDRTSDTGPASAGGRSAPPPGTGLARYGTEPDSGCDVDAQPAFSDALRHLGQGHQLCLSGQFVDAEASFRTVIDQAPDWPMAHNNLGWALQAQGKNDQALLSYNKALALRPALLLARANLAFLLANLYFSIGKLVQAKSMWLILAQLYPDDYQVLDHLIGIALRLHDLPDAGRWASHYAALTKPFPSHPAVPVPAPRLTRGKLRHDLEQYQYLRQQGVLGEQFDVVIRAYREAAERLAGSAPAQALYDTPTIKDTYGRIVHHYPARRLSGNALAHSGSRMRAEQDFFASELGIVVIDDFLSPQALSELQKFCLESTVWHSNRYSHDRLGAFFREGFNCPLLLQIAEELQQVFPNLIGTTHPLLQMWGYKYRHDQPATHPHADFAAVNVNFWITPDDANQDSESGGLVIYDLAAPQEWNFEAYNREGEKIAAFLKSSDARSTVIPYRCNRAIVFDSDLFHATAPLAFRPGYTDQRINITMLYGERVAAHKR